MSPRERVGYVQTQIDLMQSGASPPSVARPQARVQAGHARGLRERHRGIGNIDEWIGTQLLEKLKADTTASNVLGVQFSNSDPKYAAQVANAFTKAFLDVSLSMRTEPTREAGPSGSPSN